MKIRRFVQPLRVYSTSVRDLVTSLAVIWIVRLRKRLANDPLTFLFSDLAVPWIYSAPQNSLRNVITRNGLDLEERNFEKRDIGSGKVAEIRAPVRIAFTVLSIISRRSVILWNL